MEVFNPGSAQRRNFECGDRSGDITRLMLPSEGASIAAKEVAQNRMHLHHLLFAYGLVELNQDAYG